MSDVRVFEIKNELNAESLQWDAWSKQLHDPLQPINELVDNAIAAILALLGAVGKIYVNINFKTNIGSIEHSGGTTFPLDIPSIIRCFAYGGKKPSSLNEHGCGLKTSLAILDKSNSKWKIYIKIVEGGVLKFFSISAPYSNTMHIIPETAWPGANKSAEPGSFIQFPVAKTLVRSLYKKQGAKMTDKDVDTRFKNHLGHMWQRVEKVVNGDIQIFYNNERVEPFSFQKPGVFDVYVDDYKPKKTYDLSSGGKVEVEEIKLREGSRKIPGTNIFAYAQHANGAYLFKNGRHIESICAEDARELYSRTFGSVPHHGHNGTMILVNLVGDQDVLPPTVPTKNRFGASELFDELITLLSEKLTRIVAKEDRTNESAIVARFKEQRERTMLSAGITGYSLEGEKQFLLSGAATPPIDLVETTGNKITVMEFKALNKVRTQDLAQLFFNWSLACASCPGKGVCASLYIAPSANFTMIPDHREYLHALAETHKFYPTIFDHESKELYKQGPV